MGWMAGLAGGDDGTGGGANIRYGHPSGPPLRLGSVR